MVVERPSRLDSSQAGWVKQVKVDMRMVKATGVGAASPQQRHLQGKNEPTHYRLSYWTQHKCRVNTRVCNSPIIVYVDITHQGKMVGWKSIIIE